MSAEALNPRQFFHGTDVDIEGGHIEPGHGGGEASRFFGGNRSSSRVFVASTAEGAARYGKHVYQVQPKRGARGVSDWAGNQMYRQEGHPDVQAHSFKSPMKIVRKVEGASYSTTSDEERLQNLRWLKQHGHEVSPEGEQWLKEHG